MTTVYDSSAPPAPSWIKDFLAPVVEIRQGDLLLYSSGDPYPNQSGFYWLAAAGVLTLAILGIRRFR